MRQLNFCFEKLCHNVSNFPNTSRKGMLLLFCRWQIPMLYLSFCFFLLTASLVSGSSFRSPWYILAVNLFKISFTSLSRPSANSKLFVVKVRSDSCFRFALIFIFLLFINHRCKGNSGSLSSFNLNTSQKLPSRSSDIFLVASVCPRVLQVFGTPVGSFVKSWLSSTVSYLGD